MFDSRLGRQIFCTVGSVGVIVCLSRRRPRVRVPYGAPIFLQEESRADWGTLELRSNEGGKSPNRVHIF
jgi:hypothetical protein